jgi:quercetin dioxygenase-like cupin family protein
VSTVDAIHCSPLAAAVEGADANRAQGAALSMSTQSLRQDEVLEFAASALGEEVAAVLNGRVDIVAAGEHYVLSAGEAILIPALEARRYQCLEANSVLYRVVCDAVATTATTENQR